MIFGIHTFHTGLSPKKKKNQNYDVTRAIWTVQSRVTEDNDNFIYQALVRKDQWYWQYWRHIRPINHSSRVFQSVYTLKSCPTPANQWPWRLDKCNLESHQHWTRQLWRKLTRPVNIYKLGIWWVWIPRSPLHISISSNKNASKIKSKNKTRLATVYNWTDIIG